MFFFLLLEADQRLSRCLFSNRWFSRSRYLVTVQGELKVSNPAQISDILVIYDHTFIFSCRIENEKKYFHHFFIFFLGGRGGGGGVGGIGFDHRLAFWHQK